MPSEKVPDMPPRPPMPTIPPLTPPPISETPPRVGYSRLRPRFGTLLISNGYVEDYQT